ncbi:hypothetical protein BGZ95_002768 [Linnemannia exigua]|uniref:Protein kinase domain-containing protein n=1 Tax=Linnemannia exigua TaxID=604196 RepID=A0AAD4H9U3_9FUNG|nr:hypothetical protein BGZ95_002768 [Linnemannia exigua]
MAGTLATDNRRKYSSFDSIENLTVDGVKASKGHLGMIFLSKWEVRDLCVVSKILRRPSSLATSSSLTILNYSHRASSPPRTCAQSHCPGSEVLRDYDLSVHDHKEEHEDSSHKEPVDLTSLGASDPNAENPLHLAKKVLKGVALGLQSLHQRNILSQDLKPQNILLKAKWAKFVELRQAFENAKRPRN